MRARSYHDVEIGQPAGYPLSSARGRPPASSSMVETSFPPGTMSVRLPCGRCLLIDFVRYQHLGANDHPQHSEIGSAVLLHGYHLTA